MTIPTETPTLTVTRAEIMSNQAFVAGYDALAAEVLPVLKAVAANADFECAEIMRTEGKGRLGVFADPQVWLTIRDLINRIEQVHNR